MRSTRESSNSEDRYTARGNRGSSPTNGASYLRFYDRRRRSIASTAMRRDALFLTAFARDNYIADNHFSRYYNRERASARLRGVI